MKTIPPRPLLVALALIASARALPARDDNANPDADAGDRPAAIILDADGRQLVPAGFVALEDIAYTPDDYRRMARMGASVQVIRLPMNTIGAWPGTDVDDKALAHFDDLVRMGKDAGLKTIFKLVVYGIKPFGDAEWDRIWNDTDGTHDLILAGWSRVWLRYKDEPAVFGYDLLNEPARGLDDNYERTQSQRLLPLLRRLTDAMRAISPDKWALYQPLLRKPEDQKTRYRDPVVPIDEPFGRDRVIYAPHLYQMNTSVIGLMLDNLERQARISNAPLLLGEWGSPTRQTTDDNPADQARFTEVYRLTAGEMDRRGIGGIKPWFCGTRRWIPVRGSTGGMTWAIFSDPSPAGRDERGYITDVIVRPRPVAVAGRLRRHGFDFTTNTFATTLDADPTLGATEIFVSADRHFPRGFRVEIGPGLTLTRDPAAATLHIDRAETPADRDQAASIRWDDDRQRLMIDRWIGAARTLTIQVMPRPEAPAPGATGPG